MGGACCGGSTFYPEIDEVTSLSELSKFLREKQDFVVKQAEEIKEYIDDKGKIPKSIEVAVTSYHITFLPYSQSTKTISKRE